MTASAISEQARDASEGTLPLDELAYRRLRSALIEGSFSPGDRLSIRRVAAALGTSPMPARTALRRLAAEQAVDLLPSGTAVVPRLSAQGFAQLSDIRAELEPLAIRMSAAELDGHDLDSLTTLLLEQDAAKDAGDPVAMLAADREFLFRIYRACGSAILLQFIESLWLRRGPLFWEARWVILGRSGRGHRHADILDALRQSKHDVAAEALRDEIRSTTKHLLENLTFEATQRERRLPALPPLIK